MVVSIFFIQDTRYMKAAHSTLENPIIVAVYTDESCNALKGKNVVLTILSTACLYWRVGADWNWVTLGLTKITTKNNEFF